MTTSNHKCTSMGIISFYFDTTLDCDATVKGHETAACYIIQTQCGEVYHYVFSLFSAGPSHLFNQLECLFGIVGHVTLDIKPGSRDN